MTQKGCQSPKDNTTVIFNLEYFNTSSSKCILDLLRKLETLKDTNNITEIKWYFDEGDEDMEYKGKKDSGDIGGSEGDNGVEMDGDDDKKPAAHN